MPLAPPLYFAVGLVFAIYVEFNAYITFEHFRLDCLLQPPPGGNYLKISEVFQVFEPLALSDWTGPALAPVRSDCSVKVTFGSCACLT